MQRVNRDINVILDKARLLGCTYLVAHGNISKNDVLHAAAANRADGTPVPKFKVRVFDQNISCARVRWLNGDAVIAIVNENIMNVDPLRTTSGINSVCVVRLHEFARRRIRVP